MPYNEGKYSSSDWIAFIFKDKDLEEIAVVGQGLFGALWESKYHDEETDTVVVKMLHILAWSDFVIYHNYIFKTCRR